MTLTLSDDQYQAVLLAVLESWAFTGVVYGRREAELVLERPLTEEEWEKLKASRAWRRLPELMAWTAWDEFADAVESVIEDV